MGQIRVASEDDIFRGENAPFDKTKHASIDIMLRPIDNQGEEEIQKSFSYFWNAAFTDDWIQLDSKDNQWIGIRSQIKYDSNLDSYKIEKFPIKEWGTNARTAKIGSKISMTDDMHESIRVFYMDAQRDIVDDLRDKTSYFSRTLTTKSLSKDTIQTLEEKLTKVNKDIVANLPSLSQTKERISKIASTIGSQESILEIEALANKLNDLHRGMDIVFKDGKACPMPIRQHGMGTRSWISYLTLGAFVDFWIKEREEEQTESYVLLTMEEPEANLHPQAQRQLYSQLLDFPGQKVISTHSPYIVSQVDLKDIIHFNKAEGKTIVSKVNISAFEKDEIEKNKRDFLKTHGDLLFSKAVILAEGITEEEALPVFFGSGRPKV